MNLRIIVADDHPVVLMGIRMALCNLTLPSLIVGEAISTDELMAQLRHQPCDILITDFSMPNGQLPDGMTMIRRIRRNFPSLKIIVMTMHSNPFIVRDLMKTGIKGLFDKHQALQELIKALTCIAQGKTYVSDAFSSALSTQQRGDTLHAPLTGRELEVLRLFGQNQSGREIAERLNRSEKTISRQKRMAMQKLGIRFNSDLADYVRETGLV